jgi:prepilin-type N-terminal cleavage/methylation domain-containing protein
MDTNEQHRREQPRDAGLTLIEMLLVILVLGILSTVVVMSVGGTKSKAEESACPADRRQLINAREAYFVRFDTTTIPDAGGAEGFELTLVEAQILRATSEYFDLDATGALVLEAGSPCTL